MDLLMLQGSLSANWVNPASVSLVPAVATRWKGVGLEWMKSIRPVAVAIFLVKIVFVLDKSEIVVTWKQIEELTDADGEESFKSW